MNTTDERVLQALRAMAWERAKGELASLLHTYYEGPEGPHYEISDAFAGFIKTVEDTWIG